MPLLPQVGRRSSSMRTLVLAMYLLLSVGAVTMAYPFLLMLSMGTAGRSDYQEYRLIQRYWVSDAALFKRYLLDMIPFGRTAWTATAEVPVSVLATWFGKDSWFRPVDIREEDLQEVMGRPEEQRRAIADDMRAFLKDVCPPEFRAPLGLFDPDSPLAIHDDYYAWLENRHGSLAAVNRLYPDSAVSWQELGTLMEQYHRRPGNTPRERDWREFLESRPLERTGLFDADERVFSFILGRDIPDSYEGSRDGGGNRILSLTTFDDLHAGKLGEPLKEAFMRSYAPARYIEVDTTLAANAWLAFLQEKAKDPATPLAARIPVEGGVAGLWSQFVQTTCPMAAQRLLRPEDWWRPFLQQRYKTIDVLNRAYGTDYQNFDEARIPHAVFRYDCFLKEKPGLRRLYIWHNFGTVFSFVAVHGRALWVTIVYVILMIVGTLTVNPLAAYAMSRFRLKETHHILIFLLATMAFPGEVLMIPSFLMIKSFPLLQIILVVVFAAAFYWLARRLQRYVPLLVSATLALVITVGVVGWVVPKVVAALDLSDSVSLMNTFWALILPSLANGFGIFLLKGFFDSLPPELYEAGLIDGASEWRMFWQITMPLCKPILAVLALGAFTAAYGAFMHAFLICQDPKMWTFMVFLYEFQQLHTVPMVMASLVVAAIPTLLVFIFCQNIILRGIVIPTFK